MISKYLKELYMLCQSGSVGYLWLEMTIVEGSS
jgi:hypothetical protein